VKRIVESFVDLVKQISYNRRERERGGEGRREDGKKIVRIVRIMNCYFVFLEALRSFSR